MCTLRSQRYGCDMKDISRMLAESIEQYKAYLETGSRVTEDGEDSLTFTGAADIRQLHALESLLVALIERASGTKLEQVAELLADVDGILCQSCRQMMEKLLGVHPRPPNETAYRSAGSLDELRRAVLSLQSVSQENSATHASNAQSEEAIDVPNLSGPLSKESADDPAGSSEDTIASWTEQGQIRYGEKPKRRWAYTGDDTKDPPLMPP